MNISKEGDEMTKAHIINLLENAVYFINEVPNNEYPCRDFHSSYDLASEISETLKKLKNG